MEILGKHGCEKKEAAVWYVVLFLFFLNWCATSDQTNPYSSRKLKSINKKQRTRNNFRNNFNDESGTSGSRKKAPNKENMAIANVKEFARFDRNLAEKVIPFFCDHPVFDVD